MQLIDSRAVMPVTDVTVVVMEAAIVVMAARAEAAIAVQMVMVAIPAAKYLEEVARDQAEVAARLQSLRRRSRPFFRLASRYEDRMIFSSSM